MSNVCAIVVTHNRINYLKSLLTTLFNQVYKLSAIILINNASSDDTEIELIKMGIVSNLISKNTVLSSTYNDVNIFYYHSSINLGGAGGFYKGFNIAKDLDYDYFWIMDDDIRPKIDCLNKLICSIDDSHLITVPKRYGAGFNDSIYKKYRSLSPFVYLFQKRFKQSFHDRKELIDVEAFTFEGPLISKKILDVVGFPNQNYFLQGDDFDYAFRSLKYTKIRYVNCPLMERQIPISPSNKINYSRIYYSVRNMALLDLRYCKNKITSKIRIFNLKIKWIIIALKNNDKKLRLIVNKAISDALVGKDGKAVGLEDMCHE